MVFKLRKTGNNEVSPGRSFTYNRNRSEPNVEPWRTHALTSAKEAFPLITTLCLLFLKKFNQFKMLSDIPFSFSLNIIPSCQTLSKTRKIVIRSMIYDIFIIQRRIKRYDLYRSLLICQMDKFIDHVMSFYLLKYYIFTRHKSESYGTFLLCGYSGPPISENAMERILWNLVGIQ